MFKCNSGQHVWLRQEDAEKCCSGEWKRVLVIGNVVGCDKVSMTDGILYGYRWERMKP